MDADLLNGIVTFIVGVFAFVVYKIQKIEEKRNAAIIIIMDIRYAEQVVLSILEKGIDLTLKPILRENNWDKYKHLFASDFSYDNFSSFNRFFDACVEITEARKRLLEVHTANLTAKASVSQERLIAVVGDENINKDEKAKLRQQIIQAINNENWTFDPNEPKDKIYRNMQQMGSLSGMVAFEKLKKIAKIT